MLRHLFGRMIGCLQHLCGWDSSPEEEVQDLRIGDLESRVDLLEEAERVSAQVRASTIRRPRRVQP